MKTTLYLIRHSEKFRSESQKKLEIQKDSQIWNEKIILSVEGENKAKQLAMHPLLQNLDAVYSSHYARAIGTAKYISYNNNLDLIISEKLGERKVGDLFELELYGKTANYPFTKEQLLDINLKFTGGESRKEVIERATNILNEIVNSNLGKNIAVDTHACFIKHFLSSFCSLDENFAFSFKDNTISADDIIMPCIIKLEYEDNLIKNIELL